MTGIAKILISLFIVSVFPARVISGDFLSDYSHKNDWRLISGQGEWQKDPLTGDMCLTVTGGSGFSETNYWMMDYPFLPDQHYLLTCQVRKSSGTSNGLLLIGSSIVNRDVNAEQDWTDLNFYFKTPRILENAILRFGQWKVNGTVWFRNIQLTPVQPVFQRFDTILLGDGEIVQNGGYNALFNFSTNNTNSSRCLSSFNSYFNTNRWDIKLGGYLIFTHTLGNGEIEQINGNVSLSLNYYSGGNCKIEASSDGTGWKEIGSLNKSGKASFTIPSGLYPAKTIFIKLSATGVLPRFQINEYQYTAALNNQEINMTGSTQYIEMLATAENFSVQLDNNKTQNLLNLNIKNNQSYPQTIKIEQGQYHNTVKILANQNTTVAIPGNNSDQLNVYSDKNQIVAIKPHFNIAYFDKSDFGYFISGNDKMSLWWTDATQKISKTRPVPTKANNRMFISAARNEYEPVQLVINAKKNIENVSFRLTPFTHTSGENLPLTSIRVLYQDYVYINKPTDTSGNVGWWPDPLPPLLKPFSVPNGENQPLWILFYIPGNALSGDYTGFIKILHNNTEMVVPITIHVWDFELPKETHLKTALSLYSSFIQDYHHFTNKDNLEPVLDKYFKDFADHRLSPYDPFVLGDMKSTFNYETLDVNIDFTKFDQLGVKYLDKLGFNSFRLNLEGLRSSNFFSENGGKIGHYKPGSVEYNKLFSSYLLQVQNHLEKQGWLDKAYLYKYDEPEPSDYTLIKDTFDKIHAAAPKIRRMLTEEPVPPLYKSVDLWCPKSDNFDPKIWQERKALGEQMWWYICSSPKAPFCTLFIDHPAVELRTWVWQSWKYDLDGILIWSANYWSSEAAFPPPQRQNPYQDPMSYQRGYGLKSGDVVYWGNGDGRLIYPPKQVFESNAKNYLGPVSSIRWEILREGLEDYEYFWILEQEITLAVAAKKNPKLVKQARELLLVPEEVTTSLTKFSQSPEPIYKHRQLLAEMIEMLRKNN